MRSRTRMAHPWIVACGLVVCGLAGGSAYAQGPGSKPFENIYRRPNVSPYNQISNFSNDPQVAANLYQQIVVPQLEQQRQQVEQISQRQAMGNLQNQVQQIQRDTSARQIDSTIRPTGHASAFQNYSHFYPQRR